MPEQDWNRDRQETPVENRCPECGARCLNVKMTTYEKKVDHWRGVSGIISCENCGWQAEIKEEGGS